MDAGLYVYSSTFHHPPSHQDLLGAACIIFWTLTSIALVKYVMIVLHADDDGEGELKIPSGLWSRRSRRGIHICPVAYRV